MQQPHIIRANPARRDRRRDDLAEHPRPDNGASGIAEATRIIAVVCDDWFSNFSMNNLEALIIVRGAARVSGQMRTKQGITAGKVVDRKIQSLMRKKAWRDQRGTGAEPVHMGDENFRYEIPDDPITAALRNLVRAERATIDRFTSTEIEQMEAALKQAEEALAGLENVQSEPREGQTL